MLDGRESLLTPEGIRLAIVPAGPARRGFAWAIDTLVWALSVFVIAYLTNLAFSGSELGVGLFLVVLFLSYWGYPVLCEVYAGGRTLGKRAMGLQVVRDDGLPVGWRESSLRNLLLVADFMPFMYATGLISMLVDGRFRRLGDLVAGTMVVYRARPSQRRRTIEGPSEPLPFALSPEQQRTIIDLIERCDSLSLPHDRQIELAEIAAPLTGLHGEASLARLRAYAAGLTR
ncbi:RDD family protein [Chitinimonas sp.]|uniref:RDD family protein n=1 Tax=Chitinimonas sp. TaxID=1934313 RepID=UPI0035B057F3